MSPKRPMSFEVGQTVLLVEYPTARPDSTVEASVTRVGRTSVYIERYGREVGFNIARGTQNGVRTGEPAHIYTQEQWGDRAEHARLTKTLAALGIAPANYGGFRFTTATLRRLIEIAEADNA